MQCGLELGLSKNTLIKLKVKMQTIKDVWKLVVTPKIEQIIKKQVDVTTPSAFLIEIIFTYTYNEKECEAL